MAINFYDAGAVDGLFQILYKGFITLDALNTSRGTTIPTDLAAILARFHNLTSPSGTLQSTLDGIYPLGVTGARGADGLASGIQSRLQAYLQRIVQEDQAQPDQTLTPNLKYMLADMIAQGYKVATNVVSATVAAGGSNVTDCQLLATTARGDGQTCQHIFAEVVKGTIQTAGTSPTLLLQGVAAASGVLNEDWPAGSGANLTLTASDPSNTLLSNGDFEDQTYTDIPDGWTVDTGVVGTSVYLTNPMVQTLTIAGTPTGGTYLVRWVDAAGITRTTATIAFDATASALQTALRAILGLSAVTVTSTGTSPNFVHTITLTGVGGAPNQFTAVSHLTGGSSPSVTPATVTAGDAGSYKGTALVFDSDGSELSKVHHPLSLQADTVYFCGAWVKRIGAAAAGVIKFQILDGINGTVTTDSAGNSNELSFNASALTGGFDFKSFAFRIKPSYVNPVYLRISITTAVTATANIYFDQAFVVAGQELYPGGPWVAFINGKTAAVPDDVWTLTDANDRAGYFQNAFNRHFGMAAKGLVLPITGSTTIPAA